MTRILLIDDDPLVRTSLADALSDTGHEVAEAFDGNQGLAALARGTFDLVVLDILMPEREGIVTIREIRKRWAALPVLAISGGDRTGWCDYLRMACDFGADDTLAKPFGAGDLVACVTKLLGRGPA